MFFRLQTRGFGDVEDEVVQLSVAEFPAGRLGVLAVERAAVV